MELSGPVSVRSVSGGKNSVSNHLDLNSRLRTRSSPLASRKELMAYSIWLMVKRLYRGVRTDGSLSVL